MKFIFLVLFVLGCWFTQAFGQSQFGSIQFMGCGDIKENTYYDGTVLYAIRDKEGTKPFGRIVFTPQENGHPWTFSWTYNGVVQPVNPEDTISLTVDIPGDGLLTFRAEKDGVVSASAPDFHVFYDHVPEFSIRLSDIYNCVAITIDEITDFQIPYYDNLMDPGKPYPGSKPIYYLISGRTTPVEYNDYEYAFKPKEGFVAVTSEDREVSVTITDKFGFEWTSKPEKYTSYIPEAKAELKLLNNVDVVGEANPEMGQAPLEVEFYNNSYNAGSYEWLLYRDTSDIKEPMTNLLDSLIGGQVRRESEFTYTYEHSGRYKVRLIAINDKGVNRCQDTTDALYVNVVESLVDVPNVFTPNGDGKNDIFKVKALSVESFQAVILNRWGRKVYEWTDPQGGWDGRIHGKYATPGTYFYIVTARGREKSDPPKYVKKGALLLVR